MHNEPKVRHPDCPDVHIGVCPKCWRLYARDAKAAEEEVEAVPARPVSVSSGAVDVAPEEPSVSVDDASEVGVPVQRSEEGDAPSHPECGEAHILTNAQRQKKWRDKQGEAYREWNRERMKLIRQRGGPKPP